MIPNHLGFRKIASHLCSNENNEKTNYIAINLNQNLLKYYEISILCFIEILINGKL